MVDYIWVQRRIRMIQFFRRIIYNLRERKVLVHNRQRLVDNFFQPNWMGIGIGILLGKHLYMFLR